MRTLEAITVHGTPPEEDAMASSPAAQPYLCRSEGLIRGRRATFQWRGTAGSPLQAAQRAKTELADAIDVLFGPSDRRAARDGSANLGRFEVEPASAGSTTQQNYLSVECRWPTRLWRKAAPRIAPLWTRRPLSRGEARAYCDIALASDSALLQTAMANPHGAEVVAYADLLRAPERDRVSSSLSNSMPSADTAHLSWPARRLLCHLAMRALDESREGGQLESQVAARIASQGSATLRALKGASAATDARPLARMLEEELRPDLARMLRGEAA